MKSFNGNMSIRMTCDKTIRKRNRVPCQAVHNCLVVDDMPRELAGLEKLEQILISRRIVFEKIVVMPKVSVSVFLLLYTVCQKEKSQQRKIKGAICNVPVDCEETCNILPRPPNSSGIIMLKLKRKLQFRGHVYFQAVRPEMILCALQWLQGNNELYQDISINMENIDPEVSSVPLEEDTCSNDVNCSANEYSDNNNSDEDNCDDYEKENPLDNERAPTCETCLQSNMPNYPVLCDEEESGISAGNEIFEIAPGENKHPVCMMMDKYCEELAFPVLFPKGRFGYKMERKEKLTPVRYFNARLLHYTGRFAMNPEYLFFCTIYY